jgi:hypothetical protein
MLSQSVMVMTNLRLDDLTEELGELVDAFEACTYMNDSHRSTVLERLPSQIQGSIQYDSTRRGHIANILTACLNYSDDGIQKLIHALYIFEGDSKQMLYLKQEIKLVLRTKPVERKLLLQLRTLLRELPKSLRLLRYCFRKSYGESLPVMEGEHELQTRERMLSILVDAPRRSISTFPILEFFARIAAQWPETANQIAPLLEEAADQLKVSLQELDNLHRRVTAEAAILRYPPPPSLMIMLRPRETDLRPIYADEKQFIVQAWLWHSQEEVDLLKPDPDATDRDEDIHTRGEMADVLHELLYRECLPRLRTLKNLIIEFFLPLQLLDYDVEYSWSITTGIDVKGPLGIEWPVVVRSRERVEGEYVGPLWSAWQKKWEQYRICAGDKACQRVLYDCSIEEQCGQTIESVLEKDDIIFLALTHVLPTESADVRLQAALNTGTPIVLWHKPSNELLGNMRQRFDELLSQCSLEHLPRTICQKRKQPDWQDHHLKLLWDSLDRLPFDPIANLRGQGPRKMEKKS